VTVRTSEGSTGLIEPSTSSCLKHIRPGSHGTPTGRRLKPMPIGHERTKEQLYREAKRLGVKGRSKMNKGQLKAALSRRGH
jgi:hypothetical protein